MLAFMAYLTSAQGRSLRAKRAGQMRARFWRTQGFPNLVLARAAKSEKRRRREEQAGLAKRAAVLAGAIENLKRR